MGTRKKFSAAEQELLRANPYTEKVTENQISFTLAFKEAFWRLSVEGCTGNMALRKLGYDPELLGFERVHNITKRIRRAGKSPEGIQPAPKSRMRISREQFGAAELEKMSRRESERRMQQEIVYLQQMAFLKKLMRQPEETDSDNAVQDASLRSISITQRKPGKFMALRRASISTGVCWTRSKTGTLRHVLICRTNLSRIKVFRNKKPRGETFCFLARFFADVRGSL